MYSFWTRERTTVTALDVDQRVVRAIELVEQAKPADRLRVYARLIQALTERRTSEIMRRRVEGESVESIQVDAGLSRTRVYQIVEGVEVPV